MHAPPQRLVLRLTQGRVFDWAVRTIERGVRWRDGRLAVLTFHRIGYPLAEPHLHPGLLSATPGTLREQLLFLTSRYRVVSLEEVLAARRGEGRLPRQAVALTFDDAYDDFAEHAWPVLRRAGVAAALFVPTGFPDREDGVFWWDHLYHALVAAPRATSIATPVGRLRLGSPEAIRVAFNRLRTWLQDQPHETAMTTVNDVVETLQGPPSRPRVLSWATLRELRSDGVTLAPHSVSHPILTRVARAQVTAEIVGSREDLESSVGPTLPVFAYPAGRHNKLVRALAEAAGIELGFTVARGGNRLAIADPLRLRRINVGLGASPALVRAQLVWALSG